MIKIKNNHLMAKKILIIDDDNRNIFALKAVLKAKGYNCTSAMDAEEGINLMLSDKDISVVLMDMMMPDMDGYQAIEKMKNSPELSKLPVIAVTAQAMVGDRERCLNAGAIGYVSKPINIDDLTHLLLKFV
jgi:two-component system, cell cycle response regulator DivK